MIPSQIYNLVKRYTGVNATQYPEADFIEDLNIIKDEIWTDIVASKLGKINFDIWTTNTLENTGEYKVPLVSSSSAGAKTLKSIQINYDGKVFDGSNDLIYVKAIEVNPYTLSETWSYYQHNQSMENPIFFESDNSIFIAPLPKAGYFGANRLRIEGVKKIPDYTISTLESSMKIPVDYHRVLVFGIIPFALMSKRVDNNQIMKAQSDYASMKDKLLKTMSELVEGPSTLSYPGDVDNLNGDIINTL